MSSSQCTKTKIDPPAAGFKKVEIPGERERKQRQQSNGIIAVTEKTWKQILELSEKLKLGR